LQPTRGGNEDLQSEVSRLQTQVNSLEAEVSMFNEAIVEQEAAGGRACKASSEMRQRAAVLRGFASVLSHKTLSCQGYIRRLTDLIEIIVRGQDNGSKEPTMFPVPAELAGDARQSHDELPSLPGFSDPYVPLMLL